MLSKYNRSVSICNCELRGVSQLEFPLSLQHKINYKGKKSDSEHLFILFLSKYLILFIDFVWTLCSFYVASIFLFYSPHSWWIRFKQIVKKIRIKLYFTEHFVLKGSLEGLKGIDRKGYAGPFFLVTLCDSLCRSSRLGILS